MTRLEHEPCPIPGAERHQRVLGAPLGLLAGAACRGRGGCPHLPAPLPGFNCSVLHYVNKCPVLVSSFLLQAPEPEKSEYTGVAQKDNGV